VIPFSSRAHFARPFDPRTPAAAARRARSRVSRSALLAVLACALVPAAAAHAADGASAAPTKSGKSVPRAKVSVVTLTNYQRDYARWAYTGKAGAAVHSGPGARYGTVAHLHLLTEDGLAEVYELVAQRTDSDGTTWVQIMVPERPNGVTGWVPEDDLGPFHLVDALLYVDQQARKLTLYQNGKVVFTAPVGVGKPSTPTPAGHFWVREKFPIVNDAFYGPFALGTSDYSNTETDWPGGGIIGIHGTDAPSLIPGNPSHGCVRMRDQDITRLYKMVSVGTPIIIS
jgi:hypothetical protein